MTYHLALDYPTSQRNVPRYAEPHPGLDRRISGGQKRYAETLTMLASWAGPLAEIDLHSVDPTQPSWVNGFLPGLDSAALYAFLRSLAPARYFEIGSGNSTRFAARAIVDGQLATRVISIDPEPRAEINDLCDEVIRAPLEAVNPALWSGVHPGDVVFMDGSHRVFMNSDVVAFFLDVLPALPNGVLVGIHDIYLPYDYPVEIADRYYSEQYVLAAWLLGGPSAEIVLPAHWATIRMREAVERLWSSSARFEGVEHHGAAFWLRT